VTVKRERLLAQADHCRKMADISARLSARDTARVYARQWVRLLRDAATLPTAEAAP